jgi:ABC-2 type transport system ATP-binding protein
MSAVIELKNVTKIYGSSRGVEDVTLKVPEGSIFGFLGPNGAGKTTTISMLIDLIRPTSGEIEVLGLDAKTRSREIRTQVGFLAGDMALDASLNGWQQLEYLGNLRGKFDRAYVAELAKRLDCDLGRKFKHLSRGNRQKVGLIAALMNKPELLIFDEPTSGLDPLTQAEFNKIILEHKAAGKTAFISSHMLSEVQEICDSVTFIREGRIIATKSVNELAVESPKLLRLHADKSALAEVEKLAGIIATNRQTGLLDATYQGDLNKLLAVLATHKIKDFSLSDTDLETAFMKYYEDKNA